MSILVLSQGWLKPEGGVVLGLENDEHMLGIYMYFMDFGNYVYLPYYYYYYTLYYSVSGFRVHYEYASIVIETFVEAAKNVLAVHRTYLELWLTTNEHSCLYSFVFSL